MLIAEINSIITTDTTTSWIGRLFDCELKNVEEYDEDDQIVLVERLIHNHLDDTHDFEVEGVKTIEEVQQITEEYYGI